MKNIYTLVASLLLTFFTQAQNIHFDWVRKIPDASGSKVLIESNKELLLVGRFTGTTDFDAGPGVFNLTSAGSTDIYIAKYDTAGNFLWAKRLGTNLSEDAYDVKYDHNGDIIIIGLYQSTMDFDPGPGVQNLNSVNGSNTYILKLDRNANFIWVKSLVPEFITFNIDQNNNILLAGSFDGSKDFDPGPGTYMASAVLGTNTGNTDMAIVKLDNDGNFIWMKQTRNTVSTAAHTRAVIKADSENNIYISGGFSQSIDFDPGPGTTILTSDGLTDGYLLKLTTQGDFIWVKRIGGTSNDGLGAFDFDSNDNIFIAGPFRGTVDLDPGPSTFMATTINTGSFILKLDKAGNFIYAKTILPSTGSAPAAMLVLDASYNIYIFGIFDATTDFDPGPAVNLVGPRGGIFTLKLDPAGNFLWISPYKFINASFFTAFGWMAVDIFKNVYITGNFIDSVDFDPGPDVHAEEGIRPSFDMYIHKLGQCQSSLKTIDASSCGTYTLNSVTYNSPGTYYQTLTNSIGCDSIIQLNLTKPQVFSQFNASACESYSWNGNSFTTTGTYKDTLISSLGCDSIVTLNLQINPKPTPYLGKDTVICKGNNIILAPGTYNSYSWSNNTTGNSITIADTGTYWVQVTNANNCSARDSIRIAASNKCDCVLDDIATKVYAAPFSQILIVQKNPTVCEVRMILYNTLGQLLYKDIIIHDGVNLLPLRTLADGMYFYRLYSGNEILKKGKILKQRDY